jgi:hypothetical protein
VPDAVERPYLSVHRPVPDRRGRARGSGIAELLISTVNGMDSAARVRESLAFAYWARVVGAQAAAATEVESVRDGILFVRTKSSVWSHELTLHKAKIVDGLNRMLGGRVITEIVYRARGVKKPVKAEAQPDTPEVAELDAVVLDPAEQAELQAHLRRLPRIRSERIRAVMELRMVRDAKLRHWRIERGWSLCSNCAGIHKTEYELCPLCRLTRR